MSTGARGPDRPANPLVAATGPAPATAAASPRPIALTPTRSIGRFHPLPVIGHPEAFYLKHAKEAEAAGDKHARAAHKVGQYVTSALAQDMPWDEKLRRFLHALDKYCAAPPHADESLLSFYQKLAEIVRRYAGQEAVLVARKHHDRWAARLKAGDPREDLEDEAEIFFFNILGHGHCPDWCSKESYQKIIAWRDYWV